jgi:UDP-N-acetylmuramyl pentapeptide phosphotransferase/UDP-N-acetylglucosamine-1-phosphate transferase
MVWEPVIVIGVSSAFAFGATRLMTPLLRRNGVLDVPNERSSHAAPTPRGGGIGIICGILFGCLALAVFDVRIFSTGLLVPAAIVAVVGFLDDRTGRLPILLRLAGQTMAAAIVLRDWGQIERLPLPEPLNLGLGSFAGPITLIWIVGVTNIYNFLDGIDGFAGLQGVIAGVGLFAVAGPTPIGWLGLAIAGGCIGFLVDNWHPAKVFMGDGGSYTLGFLIAAAPLRLPLDARSKGVFAIVLCLWFFLSDGTFTIVRRLLRRQRIWSAHRSHLYQRLVITGLRHDQVTVRVLGAGSVLAGMVVWSIQAGYPITSWLVLILAITCFIVYWRWTSTRERLINRGSVRFGERP